MTDHQEILFWTFMGFFVVIGILSLLAVLGLIKVDERFRKWAVTVFFAGVTGAVVGLFKLSFPGSGLAEPLFVSLIPPENVSSRAIKLVAGGYSYDEPTGTNEVKTVNGKIEVTWGNDVWQAKLPQQVLGKPVKLFFKDQEGSWWEVHPFYPNHNKQDMFKGSGRDSNPPNSLWLTPSSVAYAASSDARLAGRPWPVADGKKSPVKFNNYARDAGEIHGRKYYEWRVFVDEPDSVLQSIKEVQYVLHPTFLEPLQVSRDATKQFELVTSGWGQFTILITIVYRDGTREKASYYLDLSKSWPFDR
ncbi:protein of unknown function [Nitrospira defluvii]|jgi:hypothetical protein|uniref:YEATS domain-containing protein n=1 Tax=Nitrospira defluvii TaxID=330214 RepID=D8P7M7_9BACT|nr:protein of unknown function [Nitrospira defluvii]